MALPQRNRITFDDFNQICRLCLSENDLQRFEDLNSKLINCILLMIKMEPDDSLPQQICKDCLSLTWTVLHFKLQCKHSETLLREVLHNTTVSEVNVSECHTFAFDEENTKYKTIGECNKMESDEITKEFLSEDSDNNDLTRLDENGQTQNEILHTQSNIIEIIEVDINNSEIFSCGTKDNILNINSLEHEENLKTLQLKRRFKKNRICQRKLHVCDKCGKQFKTPYKLKIHMAMHSDKTEFKCHICDTSFKYQTSLSRHLHLHDGLRPFVCEICGKEFRRVSYKKSHMLIHSKISCPDCGKSFIRQNEYQRHLKQGHEETMKTEILEKPNPYNTVPCLECNRTFSSPLAVKAHHTKVHLKNKPFLCSLCGKSFATKGCLQIHSRIHSGAKPFSCSICNKCFSHKPSLNAHKLRHSDVRPYICEVCSKQFTQLSHLQRHSRIHTGEKPFECHFCKRRFTLKENLTVHIRIHTGEKPFHCPHCNMAFSDSSSMRKHSRKCIKN